MRHMEKIKLWKKLSAFPKLEISVVVAEALMQRFLLPIFLIECLPASARLHFNFR